MHIARFERSQGIPRLVKAYIQANGLIIKAGPFQGMRYISESAGSTLIPKLVGSYEVELTPTLSRLLSNDYRIIADVGSAEGYYAVGLALRFPHASVVAFDIDARARRLCRRLAAINGVSDRVSVRASCCHQSLRDALTSRALLVCDCEGYEIKLLDPAAVPSLRSADIVVELHEHLVPDSESVIRSRFSGTHDIELITSSRREPKDYPAIRGFEPVEQYTAVNELRPADQRWVFLRARL